MLGNLFGPPQRGRMQVHDVGPELDLKLAVSSLACFLVKWMERFFVQFNTSLGADIPQPIHNLSDRAFYVHERGRQILHDFGSLYKESAPP